MIDKYISFYFDTSVSPVIYGVTVWSGSVQASMVSGYPVINIQITLDDIESGVLKVRDIAAFVSDYSSSRISKASNDRIILEKSPDMSVLEKELKKTYQLHNLELVERDTTISEQVVKYSMMFDRDRFFVGSFQVEPDLIFDEVANINLIDPIYSDEQTVFPMTQALLVGCHYLEKQYRAYSGCSVGGKIKLPDFGGSQKTRYQNGFLNGF